MACSIAPWSHRSAPLHEDAGSLRTFQVCLYAEQDEGEEPAFYMTEKKKKAENPKSLFINSTGFYLC